MGKPTICIGENKDADCWFSHEAAQMLCTSAKLISAFVFATRTVQFLVNLLKSEISSFQLFPVLVQAGLCRTCSETTLLVFPRGGSFLAYDTDFPVIHRYLISNHRKTSPLCFFINNFVVCRSKRLTSLRMSQTMPIRSGYSVQQKPSTRLCTVRDKLCLSQN